MRSGLRPSHRRRAGIALAFLLVAGGCGARLTQAQISALGGTGASVAAGTVPSASNGPATGGGSGAVPTASPGGPVAEPGGGSVGGGQSTASTVAGLAALGGTTATTAALAGGQQQTSGPGPAAAARNPLAGPSGRICPAGAPGSGPGVTSSTVTVGNISTINGPVPGLFAGARYGAQAVAAYINSMGGLCGRKVVVNAQDDEFDQATNQNEASTMAGSILSFLGSFSLQDSGIATGAPGVPDIGETLTATRFSSPANFSPTPNPPGYITGPYLYFKSDPKYSPGTQHMAALVENTPQTLVVGQYMIQALKSIGYNFTFIDTSLQPTDPTFNGDVQKMKAAGVTGVVFQATGTIIGQLANALYQAGINVVLGNYCSSAYDPAYIKNAGPGVEGTIIEQTLALYDGQDAAAIPMVGTLDQWYARVNPGQVPDLYATYAWMSGLLMAQAINQEGSLSRTALIEGLKQITSFDGDGLGAPSDPVAKTPPACYVLIDVKNNQFVRDPATASGFKCSPSGFYRAS